MPNAPTVFWLCIYRDRRGDEHRYIVPAGSTPRVPNDYELVRTSAGWTAETLAGLHIGSRMAADAIAAHVAGGREAA